ncbi:MAG: glycosyltransferase [Propionibacteriales bacterium]|nr:glycosyltransferase [Propionibacteriales bacterium]
MSVWAGDRADYVTAAVRSTVHEQSLRPDEVVIVRDGPVGADVETVLKELAADSPAHVTVVELPENLGLGPALDTGLQKCTHAIVARMDADDISLPHRFERQLPVIESGADIVGSGLLEFGDGPDDIVGRRIPPTDPEQIRSRSRFADPFNHPTVVYRRDAVQAAGGYQDLPLMEDYLLFAKMIAGGANVANLAEPLVCYRVGAGAYARRGGVSLFRSEVRLQRRFRELGFTTRGQYLRNVVIRGGYRLIPEVVRRAAYQRLIASYGERRSRD